MKDPHTEPILLTREQLYEEVWTTPVRQLSVRYGISDVGLAKVCKRMGIPRPARGYWRRKETGHRVRKSPLPKAKEEHQHEVVFCTEPGMVPRRRKGARISPDVFLSFNQMHPLVENTAKALRTAKVEPSGILKLPSTSPVSLHVCRSNLGKALLLVDVLFKAWIEKGYDLRFGTEQGSFASLAAGPVEIQLTIREETDGRLCVEFSGKRVSRRRSFLRRLREIKHLSLAAWTGRIFAVALSYLERRREIIAAEERRQQELVVWKAACARRAQEQEKEWRRREAERRGVEDFVKAAEAWNRAKFYREWIEVCRERLAQSGADPAVIDQWSLWAAGIAERTAPFPIPVAEQILATFGGEGGDIESLLR